MKETIQTEVVLVGAGVLGAAVAAKLSGAGKECIVIERGPRIAEGVTSRNSGVIHAGLYYPPKSLKAESCIAGNRKLYAFCEKRSVSHKKTGKWVVSKRQNIDALEQLLENAKLSGCPDLSEVKKITLPGLSANFGIFSPNSGIVDPYELTRAFQILAEESGAVFVFNSPLVAAEKTNSGQWRLAANDQEINCELVVNCTGLYADEVAKIGGMDNFRIYPWRGDYFTVKKRLPFENLIYPVKDPHSPGLGVHLTLGLDGSIRLGPDVEFWHSKNDFSPPRNLEQKKESFVLAASKYLEGIEAEHLAYDTCGIRPKLREPNGKSDPDFHLKQDLPGWINAIGIESPGLTASVDLADRIYELLK